MLLKVGDLARRSGLTVRALHHYHHIGLLAPSVRSESGYRLYNRDDVARLHAIQSLRGLGVPLRQIGSMLAGDGSDLPAIVARQLRALDSEIAQATALRERLALLGDMLASGRQPDVEDWLGTLGLMNTYAQYFSAEEIRRIVGNWPRVSQRWQPLVSALQSSMEQGLPPEDPQVQALAQQWMGMMHHWLDGDFELMRRWGVVYATDAKARGPRDPGVALMRYVEQASEPRMALWLQHFTLDELSRFRPLAATDADELGRDVLQALADGVKPASAAARRLVQRWQHKLVQAVGGDAAVARRLMKAYIEQPALRAGSHLPPAALAFLLAAAGAVHDFA